jgi:hypothetical protein
MTPVVAVPGHGEAGSLPARDLLAAGRRQASGISACASGLSESGRA